MGYYFQGILHKYSFGGSTNLKQWGNFNVGECQKQLKRKNAIEKHNIGNGFKLCIRKIKIKTKNSGLKNRGAYFSEIMGNWEISHWFRGSRMPEVRFLILLALPS